MQVCKLPLQARDPQATLLSANINLAFSFFHAAAMTNPQHQCHGVLAQAICDADPAAQISPELVHHLATRLEPLFNQRVAVFGRESKAQELVPQLVACPGCGGRLAECRSSAAAAIVVDLSGLVQKQHIPLRCRRSSCPDFGVLLWYNYTVRSGCHHFAGELPELNCFMLSATFGFSVPWLQQFHVRMVRQHASFTSEADVLGAQAAYNSQLHLLPTARLRLLISQGWFAWRLLTRVHQSNLDLASFDFLRPMEDMIGLFLPQLQREFGRTTLEEAQKATMRCDVVVLDGNAKNRRAVCGASLAGETFSKELRRVVRHNCANTPAFRRCFCPAHCSQDDQFQAGGQSISNRKNG